MSKQESVTSILKSARENWPDDFQHISPGILRLLRLQSHLNSDLERLVTKYQIQRADFGVMATLRRSGHPYCLSPTQIYHSMLFSSGGLTKVLNRLTKAGFVERLENPDDGRSKLVRLTEQGQATIEQAALELHLKEKEQMSVLSAEEQEHLDTLLAKLLTQWE